MSHELICSCLQLSPDNWPPDHYTLLDLQPGEVDAKQIEQRVQERMEMLRRYQLTHAEQVTEGMNRLAQALVCLTDPVAKNAYDAKLLPRPAERPTRPAGFRWSHLPDQGRGRGQPSRSRVPSRWLLLAWFLWLSMGVAGLGTVVLYFPAIRESYLGVTAKDKNANKSEPVKKATSKTSQLGSSGPPATPFRE